MFTGDFTNREKVYWLQNILEVEDKYNMKPGSKIQHTDASARQEDILQEKGLETRN
jgi:hypothetical protein